MSSYVTNDIWERNIKKYNYDTFTDVMTIGKSPLVLVASPKSDVNTPEQFMRLIRTATSPINVATGGGAHRTAFEYLLNKSKGDPDIVKAIKFNGPVAAVQSVASYDGKIGTEFGIMPIAVAKPLVDAGKVRAIGFTGTRKMKQFPDVPLLKDVAPGIRVYAAWSLELPKGTPQEVVDWYQKKFSAAIKSAEYQEWMDSNVVFYEESELTPAGLRKTIEELRATFLPVLEKLDLSKE